MARPVTRTLRLSEEDAVFIDRQVASGRFASASEVVGAGLSVLQERDSAVDRWLREEVAPVHDAMRADPGRARTLDDVFGEIRASHAERVADRPGSG